MLQHFDTVLAFAAIMLGVSVLVTVFTQLIIAVLGLRGQSLLWGLETLLKQADPDFKKHARAIADKILRHPLLSHTARRRATAIRKEEFIPLLEEVMSEREAPKAQLETEPSRLMTGAGVSENPEPSRVSLTAPTQLMEKVERWFDNVMDRVSERFSLRSRWVSVAISILLAFAFHLDAIALLEKLSTDNELRTSLIRSTSVLLDRANEVFALSTNAYSEAATRLTLDKKETRLLANPPAFVSAGQAENWIRAQISDSSRVAALIGEYNRILQAILRERTGRLANVADSLRTDFNRTRFVLIPKPYPGLRYGLREAAGILIASTLLSLGAPFWYNVLKNLASLRPKVADIVQKRTREQKTYGKFTGEENANLTT
jgi:hypothetical protein